MPDRLIELAIEALESKKAAIDAEIAALRKGLRPARRRRPVHVRKPRMPVAARKALSERMSARWAKWRAERAKKASKAQKPAGRAKTKPRPVRGPHKRKNHKNK